MKMRAGIVLGMFLCLIQVFAKAKTSEDSSAIYTKAHRETLSKYKEQAEEFCAKNLNRFGLYELQRYDAALDSLYKQELNDTLKSFKLIYDKTHLDRNYKLGLLNTQISTLTKDKVEAQRKFNQLLKKASIASL